MVKTGDRAPDFSLEGPGGRRFSLADFAGRRLILYFYPKDNTSGCTTEAQGFEATLKRFAALNSAVVGISRDSIASHARFAEAKGLSFTLLSDPDHAVHALYGAWGEKTAYGKTSEGALRTTVVIGPDGLVERVYEKVKAAGHAEKVLLDLAK